MSEEVVAKLFQIIEQLISQNERLLALVSQLSANDTETEFEQQVEIPQPQKTMGRLPWEMRKAKLEELHKKRKRSHTGSHPTTENTCDGPNCWCNIGEQSNEEID